MAATAGAKRLAAVILLASSAVVALPLAAPVSAEPANDPCALAVSLLCRFVPMAPDLEGDVDYTQQQPGDAILGPESAMPVDPCAGGCI